jgi:hypothetical protein
MVTMVKLTVLFGHPEDPEAFEKYYANQHLPLAAKIPNVQRFESGRMRAVDDGAPLYHRIAEVWFENAERMRHCPRRRGRPRPGTSRTSPREGQRLSSPRSRRRRRFL